MTSNILLVLDVLLIILCWLPTIQLDHWMFRVPEYPRVQQLIICGLLLVLTITFSPALFVFHALLLGTFGYLTWRIWPFTRFATPMIQNTREVSTTDEVTVFVANVYQYNRSYEKLLSTVHEKQPDIALFVETDQWWSEHLSVLKEDYAFHLFRPLENTYGMLVFSKLEVTDHHVSYLVDDDKPSVYLKMKLRSGRPFQFFGVHPEPPAPQHSTYTSARDKELLKVAGKVAERQEPVIVAGDLNDVAWSYTTRLFVKTSRLLDPRVGRGMFSTFHAKHWLLRWPLDHIFCSEEFTLSSMDRLEAFGSDHFPLLARFQLSQSGHEKNEVFEPDLADRLQVQEKVQNQAGL